MSPRTLFTSVSLSIFLVACNQTGTPGTEKEGAQEGDFCAGIAGIACAEGLECELEGDFPDAGGVCVDAGARVTVEDRRDRRIIKQYVEQNINTLSPKKAEVGGTFRVTSITWSNDDIATVHYEDGHIAVTAQVKATIAADGKVKVESFEVVE